MDNVTRNLRRFVDSHTISRLITGILVYWNQPLKTLKLAVKATLDQSGAEEFRDTAIGRPRECAF
jgi:hypothetical protein